MGVKDPKELKVSIPLRLRFSLLEDLNKAVKKLEAKGVNRNMLIERAIEEFLYEKKPA